MCMGGGGGPYLVVILYLNPSHTYLTEVNHDKEVNRNPSKQKFQNLLKVLFNK